MLSKLKQHSISQISPQVLQMLMYLWEGSRIRIHPFNLRVQGQRGPQLLPSQPGLHSGFTFLDSQERGQ